LLSLFTDSKKNIIIMEEKDQNNIIPVDNQFLSRGCCHPPQMYHANGKMGEHRCCKLDVHNWLKDLVLPEDQPGFDCIEVRFKNSRKDFFRVTPDTKFTEGDIVAVEASPGHDIGIVTLTGETVRFQMRKKRVNPKSEHIKKVYRRARLSDIEKWLNAVDLEDTAKVKARKIARKLDLGMKINDVEYQGDETKAIFYYTAEERVDFRELIKLMAEEFKIRIEMRQIGMRQEAARLGGIGSCGRELCCSTWLTNFKSVTTNTARTQQLSLNPQKLAGQCGKLKCCLNYENAVYLDALKEFPNQDIVLKTSKGDAIHQKTDIFKKMMWYSYVSDQANLLALTIDKVKEIITLNRNGKFPAALEDLAEKREQKADFGSSAIEEEDINRFDKMENKSKNKRNNQRNDQRNNPRNDQRNNPKNDQRNDQRNNPRNNQRNDQSNDQSNDQRNNPRNNQRNNPRNDQRNDQPNDQSNDQPNDQSSK
jgi:cell fate regulator YaaT (PSP1 superfamily)